MFKLAAMTDEISQDFEKAIGVCVEYDLDGVEIRSVWDKQPQDITDQDAEKMKGILADAGLEVCCIASPFLKCDIGDTEQYQQHLGILRRCTELAGAFNTDIIRGFTFWLSGDPMEAWDDILKAYEEPVRILQDANCRIGIENEASTMVGSARLCRKFLRDLDAGRVGAIWDAANEVYYNAEHGVPLADGSYPEGFDKPFPDGYGRVKDLMIHMHMKDAVAKPREKTAECVRIGEGSVGYADQFQALIDDGYGGYVSLETHWRPVALPEELLTRPGGREFSESGELASRLCLENVREIVAGLRT